MRLLSVLIVVLLLTAAITGLVYALTSPTDRRRRRGLLIGSIVVGVLALTSIVLMVPTLFDDVPVKVILITTGPG